jgi:hypothetical protein
MGIIVNGTKYMRLCNNNDLKKQSLYDNLYFTLRDIFVNSETYDTCTIANMFSGELTGGIRFEVRTENFKYTNVLNQHDFVKKILRFLKTIKNEYWFDFSKPEDSFSINDINQEYIKFIDWWMQFKELITLIENLQMLFEK